MKKFNVLVMLGATLCLALGVAETSGATQINNATLSTSFIPQGGSGNSNTNFAIDRNAEVEVGLKAKIRYLGDVPTVNNVYYVPAGNHQISTTGLPLPGYADWNFDFSLNLGSLWNQYNVFFKFDVDPGTSINYQGSPVSAWVPFYQESWNYGMSSFLPTAGINAGKDGIYDIDLSVLDKTTGIMVTDSHIQVVVGNGAAPVPEPGTMMLLGFGMLGLAVYGKRRMNKEA